MYTSATPSFQAGLADFPADSSFTAALGYSAAHKAAFTCNYVSSTSELQLVRAGLAQLYFVFAESSLQGPPEKNH